MITIVYYIDPSEKDAEIEWLREQKIYPAVGEFWDWTKSASAVKIGVIVNPEAALAIKLRHKLEMQTDYRQR